MTGRFGSRSMTPRQGSSCVCSWLCTRRSGAEIVSYRLEIAVRRVRQILSDGEQDYPEVLRSLDEVLAGPREPGEEPENPDYEQYDLDRVRRELGELTIWLS